MNTHDTCKHCIHYRNDNEHLPNRLATVAKCKRYPPTPIISPVNNDIMYVQPNVIGSEDICGEFNSSLLSL